MNEKIPYERVWARKSRIKSILSLTHPTAVIIFSIAVLILALMTLPGKINVTTICLLTLSMAAAQASNGMFNEVFDKDIDLINKPWRAIPAGYIQALTAARIATALVLIGLLFALAISPMVMLLYLGGIGIGILYSVKLKRTRFSGIAYLVAYPSLPVWILVAFDKFSIYVLWIYLIAAPFTIGIHLINQLRDYDEDNLLGIKGFAQHLGKTQSIWTAFLLLILGPIPMLVLISIFGKLYSIFIIALVVILHYALIISSHWFPIQEMIPQTFRSLFRRLQVSYPLLLLSWYWIFLYGLS